MKTPETRTLRPYQQDCFRHLFRHVTNGRREVVLSGPTGSGKSLMVTYLAERLLNTEMFRLAVVLAPQCQISDAFIYEGDLKIRPSEEVPQGRVSVGGPLTVAALQWFQVRDGKRREYLKDHVRSVRPVNRVLVTTHMAAAVWFAPDLLPKDMTGRLLIVDEAHHTAPENGVGTFVKEWQTRGGTVIHVTATPFRTDGDTLIDDNAPRWDRTLASHMEGGQYAPGQLSFRTHPLGIKANTTNQLAGESMTSTAPLQTCIDIVDLWVKDKRPKAVIIVPANSADAWSKRLEDEFTRQGARVHNAIKGGQRATDALKHLLRKERRVRAYEDSTVDVILACARFNEGTDWPLCSHVYNIGLTSSFVRILQRLGRALRFKGAIDGYPEEHKNTATFTFLVPCVTENLFAQFEQQHQDHAFLTACFMADFSVGQDYILGDIQRRLEDIGHKRQGKKHRPAEETWEDVTQFIGADVQQCREAMGLMVKAVILLRESGVKKPTNKEVAHYLRTAMRLSKEQMEQAERALAYSILKKQTRAFSYFHKTLWRKAQGGDLSDYRIIREELRPVFDAVIQEFEGATADIGQADRVVDFLSRFEGRTAKQVAERLKAAIPPPQFTLAQIDDALMSYFEEHKVEPPIDNTDASPHFKLPPITINWKQVYGQMP